jgi:hypothetical protein
MKKLMTGVFFVVLGLVLMNYFTKMEAKHEDVVPTEVSLRAEQVKENEIRNLLNSAKTLEEVEAVEQRGQELANKDKVAQYVAIKKSRLLFEEAEMYMRRAVEIEKAVFIPDPPKPMSIAPPMVDPNNPYATPVPPPIPPEPPRIYHPLTLVNLEKAFALYDKARKESEKLKEGDDNDFNFNINYLKGEIYYRILELMADQESAPELFNQTLSYFKFALRNRNNDVDTSVNVELLIKNQNSLMNNANSPQARKKQMLNSGKFGVGKTSGN